MYEIGVTSNFEFCNSPLLSYYVMVIKINEFQFYLRDEMVFDTDSLINNKKSKE